MGELQLIRQTLHAAATRRRAERALHGLWIGLLSGSGCWLLLLGAYKLLPLPEALAAPAWLAPLLGAFIGFVAGAWRPVTFPAAARLIEARHRLDQRLSTAIELSSTPATADTPWTRLVVGDAASAVRGLDLARLLPLHLPAFARWIPGVLVLVVGLGFVPEYRSQSHLRKKAEAEALRENGRRLAELIRQELAKPETATEDIQQALQDAGQIGERLSQAKLTKAESLGALANVAERLKEEARQLDSQPTLEKLRQAARTPPGSTAPNAGNPALQKQLEKLQQALGATPEALDQLAAQLQEAQKLAAGMQGTAPTGGAQQALSQSLSQLAQTAAQLGMDPGALEKAIESLKDLDVDRLLNHLANAGKDLDRLRDLARKMAEMQKALEQAGKDLAEQLDRGQAQAAAETLDKMIEKLQSAGLTPEQLQSLLQELSKAAAPAADYGKVAELLRKAAESMKSGAHEPASQNLAEAARELREMARQAAESQQLADALEAIKSFQMAMNSGRIWKPGQCQGGACTGCSIHPSRRTGAGKGGRPGQGVGTWANENGWLYFPEYSERWDNSGVTRPDMASRGHTDRGEGQLSENALPTKLQGQFSPGAMPSITLKGVSIVGRSSVQMEQAVQSAQSEAQSALNQDQVPRAYRGAVKGYFDDLK